MFKTTLYLDDQEAFRVKQIARGTGRSQSEVIREAIAEYTARAPRPLPQGAGQFHSGRGDLSARAEEMLFTDLVDDVRERGE